MATQYPEECISVQRMVNDEQYVEAMKKKKTDDIMLLRIQATPFRFGEGNEGNHLTIAFYNNCRQTVTKNGKEKEVNTRCATWLCIWRITDTLRLPAYLTQKDKDMGLKIRTMIQLDNEFVLGYLWFEDTKRHSTILKHFKCWAATVMVGMWPFDLPPRKIDSNSNQCFAVSGQGMTRSGNGMHTQLVYHEFHRAMFEEKYDRFLLTWKWEELFGEKLHRGRWQPAKTPLRRHPRNSYYVRPCEYVIAYGAEAANLNYLRPNPKKQRVCY